MFSLSEIIALAVKIEKNAEAFYRRAVDQSQSQQVKELLLSMANEEKEHAAWFSTLLDGLETIQEKPLDKTMEMDEAFIGDLMGKQTFSLEEADFSAITDKDSLNKIFIEFENDTILFYELIKTFITHGPTVEHLETIINEENTHIKKLNRTPINIP